MMMIKDNNCDECEYFVLKVSYRRILSVGDVVKLKLSAD